MAWDNFSECYELAKQVAVNKKSYRLTIAGLDGTSYIIPLKNWLDECYNNYISLISRMKSDKIAKATYNKQVYEFLPKVGKLIIDNPDIKDKDILKSISGLTDNILRTILSKPISQLRKSDTSKEIKKYSEEIRKWQSLDEVNYAKDMMSKM